MALESPAGVVDGVLTPAAVQRHTLQAITGAPVAAFSGGVSATNAGAHGVCTPDSFEVTESGTPAMSVDVAAGTALITGTVSAAQGPVSVYNDAAVTVAVTAADATNDRHDLVIVQFEDSLGGTDQITVVTGTPAGSPVDPSLAAYPNALVLARVVVPALATTITDADITDLRTYAHALGGVGYAEPTTKALGEMWWDDATGRLMRRVDIGGTEYDRIIGGSFPQCNRRRETDLPVANATPTAVNLTAGVVDTDSFCPGATNVYTIPAGLGGDYIIGCGGQYAADPDGYRAISVTIGGNTSSPNEIAQIQTSNATGNTANNEQTATKLVRLEAGATLTLTALHTAGASLDLLEAFMTCVMVAHHPNLT